jgi:hypothetical protein
LSARHEALRAVQRRLERFYALERAPDVVDFVHFVQGDEPESRETLVLLQTEEALEIRLVLPPLELPAQAEPRADDGFLQLVEGVSHFVYVAERARTNLPATRLELELQAEVDKFVVLGGGRLEPHQARRLHVDLYERVRFLHPPGSEDGERYRLANDLAARFVARLFHNRSGESGGAVRALRRFYRSGQTEKIHLARAA